MKENSLFRVREQENKKEKIALEQIHWDKEKALLPWHWAQETEETRMDASQLELPFVRLARCINRSVQAA